MAGSEAPAIVHPWLGELYRHGQRELRGSIDVDPAVRLPRANGGRDVEILLELADTDRGPGLQAFVEYCAGRIMTVLTDLPSTKRHAVEHAPQGWSEHDVTQPGGPLIDRLFLEGIEVDRERRMSVLFDFGDLDLLVVRLDGHGQAESVLVQP